MEDNKNQNDGYELPEWDPEWDFMDAEDIEKKISATSSFLKALNDLSPEMQDQDYVIPEESRDVLIPMFQAAMSSIEAEDSEKMSGDVVLNFKQYKYFRDAYQLVGDLVKCGTVTWAWHNFKKTSRPINLRFRTRGALDLSGNKKDRFAEIIGHSCRFGFCQRVKDLTTFEGLEFNLMFDNMWIPVSELGTPITGTNTCSENS